MEDADLVEEGDSHTTTFAFDDFAAQAPEQGFNVLPDNVRTGRVGKDRLEGAPLRTLHAYMVPTFGTERNAAGFRGLGRILGGKVSTRFDHNRLIGLGTEFNHLLARRWLKTEAN